MSIFLVVCVIKNYNYLSADVFVYWIYLVVSFLIVMLRYF